MRRAPKGEAAFVWVSSWQRNDKFCATWVKRVDLLGKHTIAKIVKSEEQSIDAGLSSFGDERRGYPLRISKLCVELKSKLSRGGEVRPLFRKPWQKLVFEKIPFGSFDVEFWAWVQRGWAVAVVLYIRAEWKSTASGWVRYLSIRWSAYLANRWCGGHICASACAEAQTHETMNV